MADVLETPVTEQEEVQPVVAETAEDKVIKRLNDQSRLISSLMKEIKEIKSTKSESVQQQPLKGTAALEALEQRLVERENKANERTIRATILSALTSNGINEQAAKKLVPAMINEVKFEVDDDDEVIAVTDDERRPASDFVKAILLRDDWRAVLPQKKGPSKGDGKPIAVPSTPAPNEHGVYSANAMRSK